MTRAEEADANDKERIVDGVEDVVESNELRNCCVDESETVSRDNFLLMSKFCSLAIYTARKQKSIDEHNSSASSRSFNRKTINSTVEDLSLVETTINRNEIKMKKRRLLIPYFIETI
jgi:hypothetical protein